MMMMMMMMMMQRRIPLPLASAVVTAIALVGITITDAFLVPEVFGTRSTLSLRPPSSSFDTTATHALLLAATPDGGGTDNSSDIPPNFPLARRALLEKAEEIGTLSKSKSGGTYGTVGWSNRLGSLLTPAAMPGVYEAGRPFIWNSIDVGCRMVVIELSTSSPGADGRPDLFVHSPVGLDDRLAEAISAIGTVKHVVSPNYEHVKFAYQWAERYPDASMWGCPGLMEREPKVRWAGEIPYGARPPGWPETSSMTKPDAMWDWEEICPMHIDVEVNPFTGKPFFNEVVFYHPKSKSLLTTDYFWNYPGVGKPNAEYASLPGADQDFGAWELAPDIGEIPLGSYVWGKIGMDRLFKPFYLGLMIKPDRKDLFLLIASYIAGLNEDGWDVQTIIPAHGDILRGKTFCREVLKSHFKLAS